MDKEPRFHGQITTDRSRTMSRIRDKDTSIEVILRRALWNEGIRYRVSYKGLPGRPDIVITKNKIAIFCDSEYFHGKDWDILKEKLSKGSNPDYWIPKIERNMERDREKDAQLNEFGWSIIHSWEKDTKKDTDGCVRVIKEMIFNNTLAE